WLGDAGTRLDEAWGDSLRIWYWRETIVDANWKMAKEAFEEGWHVMASHPQLTMGMGTNYPHTTKYTPLPNGHGYYGAGTQVAKEGGVARGRPADEFLARMRVLWEGQDAMVLERDLRVMEGIRKKVPPGEDFPTAAVAALYEYADGARIPMPAFDKIFNGEVYVFPNYF